MNKTIYLFWLGDEEKKKYIKNEWENAIKGSNWNVEVGPTNHEHEMLLKISKFYKISFEKRIYAFCSDFYRAYKIYNNGGLYIDAGCECNKKKIINFINTLEKKDIAITLERPYYLWNGFFWFKNKNNIVLKEVCNHLEKISKRNFNHIETGPIIFSHFFFKKYGYYIENNNNILILKSLDFNPKNKSNIIYMNPSASWWKNVNTKISRRKSSQESWEISYKSFNKKYSKIKIIILRKLFSNIFISRIFTYYFINKIYFFIF